MRKSRKKIQNILIFIITIFLFFIICEICLRINIIISSGGIPTNIHYNLNSEGFRNREHNINKSNQTYRILIIGDSFTFGQGMRDIKQVYPSLLEKYLNENSQKYKYEIINFGVPGYNSICKINLLKEKGLKYRPDIVIIQHRLWYGNHELLKELGLYHPFAWEKNSVFFKWAVEKITSIFLWENITEKYNNYSFTLYNSNSEYVKNTTIQLKELKEISEEHNFSVLNVIFIWPSKYDYLTHADNEFTKFIINVSKNNNFYLLDLYDSLKDYPPNKLKVHMYDLHYNNFAKEIYNYLNETYFSKS